MAKRNRFIDLENKLGNLHEVIPPLVSAKGQLGAALELGVSSSAISRWLKCNGYTQRTVWVRQIIARPDAQGAALEDVRAREVAR